MCSNVTLQEYWVVFSLVISAFHSLIPQDCTVYYSRRGENAEIQPSVPKIKLYEDHIWPPSDIIADNSPNRVVLPPTSNP